ncbi:hypothetical protein BCY86_05705 [Pajaroellobacter abortibovis]|uniref:Uncharacterized protein n=2 Tax=Pajaroellobacter abortibovis TaxID=1882918 RepID=A0A1L6MXM3_9BACT|nr:hypothetical protein BCY86_05705 [Pajaroellobacter abortibovis]
MVDRACSRSLCSFPYQLNLFYTLNVIGGAVGVLATDYFLFPYFHMDGCLHLIFVLEGIVFLLTFLLEMAGRCFSGSRLKQAKMDNEPSSEHLHPYSLSSAQTPPDKALVSFLMVAVSFLSGFLFFSNWITWCHLLSLSIRMSVYAYAIMLFTVLLGMATAGLLVHVCFRKFPSP